MKKFKKKIIALGLGLATMASSVMSVSASAAKPVDWPAAYTPNTGNFSASTSTAKVWGLRWTSDQVAWFNADPDAVAQYSIEFEFRPLNSSGEKVDPHDIWGEELSFSSNLPSYFYEFEASDHDDITIGCRNAKEIKAGTSYFGTLTLTKKTNTNL